MGNILGNRTPNQNGVYILEPDRFTLLQQGLPVDKVRQSRGPCVAAVLIIIQAWRKAGSSRAAVDNIVTYGGAWSDYWRFPLMWLGHPWSAPIQTGPLNGGRPVRGLFARHHKGLRSGSDWSFFTG